MGCRFPPPMWLSLDFAHLFGPKSSSSFQHWSLRGAFSNTLCSKPDIVRFRAERSLDFL